MPQTISTNTFTSAKWIVNTDPAKGTHKKIQDAIDSAASGDSIFLSPGTYLENITLKAGVSLVSYEACGLANNTRIVGRMSFSDAGTTSICNVTLVDPIATIGIGILYVSGSNASIVNITGCELEINDGGFAISFTSTNPASVINITNCVSNNLTGDSGIFTSSSPGKINIKFCGFTNSIGAGQESIISAGSVSIFESRFEHVFVTSGTSSFQSSSSIYETAAGGADITRLTIGGTGTNTSYHDYYSSRSASCISVSVGASLSIGTCDLDSTNTYAITGAGSLIYGILNFPGTSIQINTTTQSCENSGTWTPVLSFSGNSVGVAYASRSGIYTRVGNTVTFDLSVVLTSKGSSAGTLNISLPFPVRILFPAFPFTMTNVTFTIIAAANGSGSNVTFAIINTGTGTSPITNTNVANNSTFTVSGTYFI